MELFIKKSRLSLIKGDITCMSTDAIVNAANSSLMGGGGVDGAIHRAGGPKILEECRQIVLKQGRLAAGKAVITSGGNLPAKYVIHTVGPVWHNGTTNEQVLLASAYSESLRLAEKNHLQSIAFPSISTGAYGYPVNEASKVAIQTLIEFLKNEAVSVREVIMVLFDNGTYEAYLQAVKESKTG
jgi:O-acetyl-ADP-ribose deacetylase